MRDCVHLDKRRAQGLFQNVFHRRLSRCGPSSAFSWNSVPGLDDVSRQRSPSIRWWNTLRISDPLFGRNNGIRLDGWILGALFWCQQLIKEKMFEYFWFTCKSCNSLVGLSDWLLFFERWGMSNGQSGFRPTPNERCGQAPKETTCTHRDEHPLYYIHVYNHITTHLYLKLDLHLHISRYIYIDMDI